MALVPQLRPHRPREGCANPRQERDLEQGLTDHVRRFLMELGVGFAFVGRQVRIEVGDEDFYVEALGEVLGQALRRPAAELRAPVRLYGATSRSAKTGTGLETSVAPAPIREHREPGRR